MQNVPGQEMCKYLTPRVQHATPPLELSAARNYFGWDPRRYCLLLRSSEILLTTEILGDTFGATGHRAGGGLTCSVGQHTRFKLCYMLVFTLLPRMPQFYPTLLCWLNILLTLHIPMVSRNCCPQDVKPAETVTLDRAVSWTAGTLQFCGKS